MNNLDSGLAASEACAVSLSQHPGGTRASTHMETHSLPQCPTLEVLLDSNTSVTEVSLTNLKSQPSVKWAPLEKTLVDPENPEGSSSNSKTVF